MRKGKLSRLKSSVAAEEREPLAAARDSMEVAAGAAGGASSAAVVVDALTFAEEGASVDETGVATEVFVAAAGSGEGT